MNRLGVAIAAALAFACPAFAQAPPEMPATTPSQPSPLAEQPEPLDTLRGFTTLQTFDVYYKSMVEEGRNFGGVPKYGCKISFDGFTACGNRITFVYNGLVVKLGDVVWEKGNRTRSVCLSKPFETTSVCGRSDGEIWTGDAKGVPTKIYRQKW